MFCFYQLNSIVERKGQYFSSDYGLQINEYKSIQRQRDGIGKDIVYRAEFDSDW